MSETTMTEPEIEFHRGLFAWPVADPDAQPPDTAPCMYCPTVARRVSESYRKSTSEEWLYGSDLYECSQGHLMRLPRIHGIEWIAGGDASNPDVVVLPDSEQNTIGMMHADAGATEEAAALAILPKTGTARRRVLDAIAQAGDLGLTEQEIELILHMDGNTVRPRLVELRGDPEHGALGWIERDGRTRPTKSGEQADVWVLTALGRAQYPKT